MIIAISSSGETLESPLDLRLGRAERFLLINDTTGTFTVMNPQTATMGHGAGIQTAQALLKAGVKIVISGDCGPKAYLVFQTAGVKVYSTTGGTAKEAWEAWKKNSLPLIDHPGQPRH